MKEDDLLNEDKSISDINFTPFIDVMFTLLIVFMVAAPLVLGGVNINLPKVGGEVIQRPDNPLIVSIDAENRVYIDKEEIPAAGFSGYLKKYADASQNGEVFVKGDASIQYERVMKLINDLRLAGFTKITLVATPAENN